MIVKNATRGFVLGTRVRRADSFLRRLRGLMFRGELAAGEGLWIEPCNSVHTHFMRFAIDVLFLDAHGRVLHVMPAMKPWRHSPFVKGSKAVLELAAGEARETAVGDQFIIEEV